ncbi:MAG TPA: hypothetical protein VJZ70_01790 [Limnochordia bacterium]|nr:hypothetical protein [Limnochordia bacterium]
MLFTGARSEPRIYAELIKEINSADQVDLISGMVSGTFFAGNHWIPCNGAL